MRSAPFIIALGSLLTAIGCAPIRLGDDSSGDLGRARFEYQSSECIFGCSLEQPALAGAMVTVIAKGGDPTKRPSARLAAGSIARIGDQRESCSCDSTSGSTSVEPDLACPTFATKSCQIAVDIETTATGDDRLEIVEPNGTLRDSIALKVRAASRIELTVSAADKPVTPTNGVYVVPRGARVELESRVLAADGSELVFTERGVSHAYGDPTVISSDKKVLFGATNIEYMATGRAAETDVVVSAPGATATARFRVTP